jgi:hypothetical protein
VQRPDLDWSDNPLGSKEARDHMNIPKNQAKAGEIPEIEDGIYVGQFKDISVRVVEEFKTDKDRFGKPDDGTRYDFPTIILDEDRQPVLLGEGDDPDAVLVIERTAKTVKAISGGEKSNSYLYLKGILTPAEMAMFQASGRGDEQADAMWEAAAAKVNGRHVMVQVTHNDKGYPQIEAFLGPAKPPKPGK